MTPMRLLFVVQRYGPEVRGGAEQAAREVAQRLAARGHHLEVLTTTARSYMDWSGDLGGEREAIEGVTVHRLPVHPLRDPDVFGRLHHRMESAATPVDGDLQREWLRAQGPSVPDLAPWLDANAGRFDVAVFFTYLYGTTTEGLPVAARHTVTALVPCAHDEPPLALHAFDRAAHLADSLLFLTPEEAELVRARFRLTTPHHVVGLGTAAASSEPTAAAPLAAVGPDPYLLYVGRIDPSKGTSWLVDSFAALKLACPSPLRLMLLGEAVVPPAAHADVVVITDADDAARDAALAGAVALVHPSPYESFGMVVTEAWAAGTPVIAFGGNAVLRGHVERSGGGLLVHTTAELAAAAELLRGDRGLRDSLGEAGRAHVQAHYTWPAVTDAWERALQRTAASGAGTPLGRAAPPAPLVHRTEAPVVPRAATRTGVDPAVSARPLADDLPPRWLALPLVVVLALVVAASAVGVVSAILGAFTPTVVTIGTVVVAAPTAALAVRALPRWSSGRAAHAAAALVVLAVAAITLWNGLHHGQHLVAERDPGVYVTTARHLIDEGDLLVPGPVGPFEDSQGVARNGVGFSPIRDDGTLEPQFPHLTAVLLAIGGWVAELGLFLVTPLTAGLGLLCLYAWATTVIGPRWAAAAVVLTGLTMPFMVFARDAYSEPITTVLAFGGLWLVHLADRSRRMSLWILAGLAIGATAMARVDAFLYLAPVTVALVLSVRLAPPERRRGAARGAVGFGIAMATTAAIGLWDTYTLTGGYFDEALGPRLPSMLGVALAAGVLAWFAAPLLWRRDAEDEVQATPVVQGALVLLAVGCLAFFAWGWWVRPDVPGLPPIAVEGVNVLSYLPQAATLSMRWLGWYLGPLPLAGALLGLLWSIVRLGGPGRPRPAVVAGLGTVLVPLLVYLWSPNITPDHPWAMRRFAAVVLPGLAVGTAAACRALWSTSRSPATTGRRRPTGLREALRLGVGPGAAVAVLAVSVASVVAITWPTRDARAQIPMRQRMHEICEALEPDDAVLVSIDGILALMMSVPVGVWCEVPSAGGTAELQPLDVARMAVEWEQLGRRLVVLSSSETPVFGTLRGSGIVTQTIDFQPLYPETIEPTITSRPDDVVVDGRLGKGADGDITFHLYVIDPERARRLVRAAS